MEQRVEEERNIIRKAVLQILPPSDVLLDLVACGVCSRCIFRLFNAEECVYGCSLLTSSMLHSVLEDLTAGCITTNGSHSSLVSNISSDSSYMERAHCSICLGILQFSYYSGTQMNRSFKGACLEEFIIAISEEVKREGHEIDGISLEISLPPVILSNERSFWLYLKEKYGSQEWYKKISHLDSMSVKDALKLTMSRSLQTSLAVGVGSNSFCIRLTYTHPDASAKLQNLLAKDMDFRKRKLDFRHSNGKESEHPKSESDAAVHKMLESMDDHKFSEHYDIPPLKVNEPCSLTVFCYRKPIYIGGRYLKFSRKVSQSRWIIDDERMGEASVEEIIGSKVLHICRGESYKFHAAGREDIDVRMLGSGRPFLVQISNAHCMPSSINIQEMADIINQSEQKYVAVRNLKVLGNEAWDLMREGEAEKQKQYAALVWISRPLTDIDLEKITSSEDLEIMQNTPIRVLHRRSPMERKRIIHWMKMEKISGSCQYFLLHLCTQAGTYIKEFVHGDLGRTHPSVGSMLGCRAEILQLDVTDVKMDCFE